MYEAEIEKCFEENPEILKKSAHNMAKWFYIQGILYQSHIVQGMKHKLEHFLMHMSEENFNKAKKEWDDMNKMEDKCLETVPKKQN